MTPYNSPLPARMFLPLWLVALPMLMATALGARANVYATNIKVNGSLVSGSMPIGGSAEITYILNEPASAGVTVRILSGSSVVRTISIAAGSPGTLRGTNSVSWNGTTDNSTQAGQGSYTVNITASAQGYSAWTQITDDNADGNAVWEGRGIAIDQNANSPYYGRVLVANSQANDPGANHWLGYQVGILKCNSDSSYADEGGLSTGGYPWAGDAFSPWHLEIANTDRVYVDDFTTNGQVIAWDPTISPGSELAVLRPDNWSSLNVSLSGPALFGSSTNLSLWMADTGLAGTGQAGLGIVRYSLLPNGACAAGDTGATAVAVGGSLTANPVDVALDPAGHIYTIQPNSDPGDPNNRVFRFPPFHVGDPPLMNAEWAIGSGNDTMAGARGIAVDPTGTYVAVAFTGLSTGSNGCTQIFYATNGALVTNLDLGILLSGFVQHEDEDCAWDAVGNLYYIDNVFGVWRAVSPPGANSSTT
ncbi:MAG TPA: FlgD immunoglobulin-like domain containing protein, partial [Patescibacteria group bacterium]|nr:FlgD immunoglobulin-like domain containing protein [Patescibacteria group bacterium]